MVPTSHNCSIAAHFGSLVGRFYAEPTDEMVMGTFFEEKQSKKKQKTKKNTVVDVRSFFKKNSTFNNNQLFVCVCMDVDLTFS